MLAISNLSSVLLRSTVVALTQALMGIFILRRYLKMGTIKTDVRKRITKIVCKFNSLTDHILGQNEVMEGLDDQQLLTTLYSTYNLMSGLMAERNRRLKSLHEVEKAFNSKEGGIIE